MNNRNVDTCTESQANSTQHVGLSSASCRAPVNAFVIFTLHLDRGGRCMLDRPRLRTQDMTIGYTSAAIVAFIIRQARATNETLPWGEILPESLQSTSVQISFDPLALLAVLHNPRASGSAARLYNPRCVDGKVIYRWPNTMMIGGALPPFKLLVDHLVSPTRSRHPLIDMYKADRFMLDVRTNLPVTSELFPVSNDNFWFLDLLNFKTESNRPGNDIMIIALDTIHGQRKQTMPSQGFSAENVEAPLLRLALNVIMLGTTFMLLAGLVCSVLAADFWSTSLFAVYFFHNLSSIAVAYRRMLSTTDRKLHATPSNGDEKIYYMIHQRPAGGKVVIKARLDTLYSWQLASYVYNRSLVNNVTHWTWMITGALSAAASVVCMVNMAGAFQLAYLAVLVSSSVLEIAATQVVRSIQHRTLHFGVHEAVLDNSYWSQAIIRAALEVDERLSLADVPWIEYGQLPPMQVFQNLIEILPKIRDGAEGLKTELEIRTALGKDMASSRLAERFTKEIMQALQNRMAALNGFKRLSK